MWVSLHHSPHWWQQGAKSIWKSCSQYFLPSNCEDKMTQRRVRCVWRVWGVVSMTIAQQYLIEESLWELLETLGTHKALLMIQLSVAVDNLLSGSEAALASFTGRMGQGISNAGAWDRQGGGENQMSALLPQWLHEMLGWHFNGLYAEPVFIITHITPTYSVVLVSAAVTMENVNNTRITLLTAQSSPNLVKKREIPTPHWQIICCFCFTQ